MFELSQGLAHGRIKLYDPELEQKDFTNELETARRDEYKKNKNLQGEMNTRKTKKMF